LAPPIYLNHWSRAREVKRRARITHSEYDDSMFSHGGYAFRALIAKRDSKQRQRREYQPAECAEEV
jgi:hypothetical protein